jgi:hypothetical protein
VLARDLQLTPGPLEYLASASQGPPAYFWTREYLALVLARDLQLTPGSREYLIGASQGPPAYSRALGVPS